MNKICTSLEQSKKLIELGIDRKTSDMYYWCGEDLRMGGYKAQDEECDIPAWSLSALMELMPDCLNEQGQPFNGVGYCFELNGYKYKDNGETMYGCCYEEEEGRLDCLCNFYASTPVDAAIEMVCWLKKEEYI